MAATDEFTIEIEGVGGHAAMPHKTVDPLIIGAQMIVGLQTLVSRNVNPVESAVLSVTVMNVGEASNVIAQTAQIKGTVRTLSAPVRDLMERRLGEFVPQFATAFGATATVSYRRGYPPTVNHSAQTRFAADVAAQISGADNVDRNTEPSMGGEDFAFMLNARPGAYIMLGQGDGPGLHQDTYDFNDEIIPIGCSYWVKLVETALPAQQ